MELFRYTSKQSSSRNREHSGGSSFPAHRFCVVVDVVIVDVDELTLVADDIVLVLAVDVVLVVAVTVVDRSQLLQSSGQAL